MENKIILIDGNNLAYRAFYALPETIATTSGTQTNAVYGFTSMLIKLIDEEKPDTIVCAFDSEVPTFRHKVFEEYKAHRKKMPVELSTQISLVKEVLDAFNIKYLQIEGYEADDILATIAKAVENKYEKIVIVTGDKDMLQLVSDKINVMSVKKGISDTILFNREKVKELYGVGPDSIKDLLALMGDSSDNIPGVPGIGPKTARNILGKYNSVEDVYKNLENIKSAKVKKLLAEYQEQAKLSKKLTKLTLSLDININELLSSSLKNIDYEKIENLFTSLEFRTLLNRVRDLNIFKHSKKEIKKSTSKEKSKYSDEKTKGIKIKPISSFLDLDIEKINKKTRHMYTILLDKSFYNSICGIKDSKNTNFNSEDKGLMRSLIFYCNGYPENNCGYFVKENELADTIIRERIAFLFQNKNISKSGFNFKDIYKYLKNFGINIRGTLIDFKIIYLILNSIKSNTNINEVVEDMSGIEINDVDIDLIVDKNDNISDRNKTSKEFTGKKNNKGQLNLEFYGNSRHKANNEWWGKDAKNNKIIRKMSMLLSEYPALRNVLLNKLREEELDIVYFKIEEPLIKVLAEMEFVGVCVDCNYLNELIKQYDLEIKKLKKDIYLLCGEKFNINSTQQLSEILYKKMGLSVVKKTKTGISTAASTLNAISSEHPIIGKILDYREKVKLKNTYIDVLPRLVDSKDGRIHTTYNQLGTTTGRISSSNPNLQNIPVRTELGKQIRKAFIPGEEYDYLLSADYSQIELRVLAHLSGDDILIDSFNKGEDIHARTASEVFDVDYEKVNEDLRRKAKAINFGIIYGMTEYGLMSRLKISEQEAREYIRKYFDRYPKVKRYIDYLIKEAYKKGYTTTIFGRKRYINELNSSNPRIRNLGERLAVNTPIQGSAADIMKLSTVTVFERLKLNYIDSNIILQVHDELVLEVKKEYLDRVKKIVIDCMENCVDLKVGLKVDIRVGENWYI